MGEVIKEKVPPTSGALKRVAELMEGFGSTPTDPPESGNTQPCSASKLDLITPRGDKAVASESGILDSPTPQGHSTSQQTSGYSEDEPIDTSVEDKDEPIETSVEESHGSS